MSTVPNSAWQKPAAPTLPDQVAHLIFEANVVLEDLLAPLLDIQVDGVGHRFTREQCRKTWAAHWAIYNSVRDRDAAAGEEAVREHFKLGPVAIEEIEARTQVLSGAGSPRQGRRPVNQKQPNIARS